MNKEDCQHTYAYLRTKRVDLSPGTYLAIDGKSEICGSGFHYDVDVFFCQYCLTYHEHMSEEETEKYNQFAGGRIPDDEVHARLFRAADGAKQSARIEVTRQAGSINVSLKNDALDRYSPI